MAGWVGEFERVVLDVGVAVQGLRGTGIRNYGICLYEAGQLRVVVAAVVEVQACVFVNLLAGVAAGDGKGAGVILIALVAEGGIAVMLDEGAFAVGHNGGGAEVVGVVIVEDGVIRLAVGVGHIQY